MSHDFARSQRLKKESARKPAARKSRKSGGVASWVWVLVGTAAGCLIMLLVYLAGLAPPQLNLKATTAATGGQPAPQQKAAEPPKRVSPVFEFYTKLPEGGQPVTDLPAGAQMAPAVPDAVPQQAAVPPPAQTPPTPAATPQQQNLDPIQQLLAEKEAAKAKSAAASTGQPVTTTTQSLAKAEAAKPAPAPAVAAAKGRYLQAGVFRNKAEVDKLKAKISMLGLKPSIQSVTGVNGETLQKVTVGPFSSAEEMTRAKIMLAGNGISAIPVR